MIISTMELIKKRIYIDMDGVICDFKKGIQDGIIKFAKHKYQQSRYGFFIGLEPMVGAIDAVLWLSEHFDVYFLTRPSVQNLSCYSEKALWIQNHFGPEYLERLIISPDKSLLKGDYLIDDSILNGQKEFEGVFIQFNLNPYFNDWNTVLKYFEELID